MTGASSAASGGAGGASGGAAGASGGAVGARGGAAGTGVGGAAGNVNDDASFESGAPDVVDASATEADVSSEPDAPTKDATNDGNPGGDTLPGKPWIHLCPKTDTHEQCCAFLCNCLMTVCSDSPLDKPGTDACMTNCPKLTDMMLRCRIYHCYESKNPSFPQDHVSHCGHASGRVNGGDCPPAVYGP